MQKLFVLLFMVLAMLAPKAAIAGEVAPGKFVFVNPRLYSEIDGNGKWGLSSRFNLRLYAGETKLSAAELEAYHEYGYTPAKVERAFRADLFLDMLAFPGEKLRLISVGMLANDEYQTGNWFVGWYAGFTVTPTLDSKAIGRSGKLGFSLAGSQRLPLFGRCFAEGSKILFGAECDIGWRVYDFGHHRYPDGGYWAILAGGSTLFSRDLRRDALKVGIELNL